MNPVNIYSLAADLLLLLHVTFVAFVVLSFILILIGKVLTWSWVRNPWFRIIHLAAIAIVVLQSWLGIACPLTTWEMALREKSGQSVYAGAFIAHWLQKLLYYQLPDWVFVLVYTLFGCAVFVSWFWVRPRSFNAPMPRGSS